MDMPRDAVYIGAGVSSLNTPNAEWNLVAPQAQLGIDVPGRSIMLLTNGHAMRIERRRVTNFGDTGVYSNKTLDPQRRSQQWWNNDPYREEDASLRGTWYRLHDLHELIASYLREAS
jgi:hypothetical protein